MNDYISRVMAIARLTKVEVTNKLATMTDAKRVIAEMPAADVAPVVHWVLTDEKLPPNGQDVLCWYEYFRFGAFNRMYQTFGIGYQFNGNWGGEVVQGQKAKVLAWMPLPKPPKMEREAR